MKSLFSCLTPQITKLVQIQQTLVSLLLKHHFGLPTRIILVQSFA